MTGEDKPRETTKRFRGLQVAPLFVDRRKQIALAPGFRSSQTAKTFGPAAAIPPLPARLRARACTTMTEVSRIRLMTKPAVLFIVTPSSLDRMLRGFARGTFVPGFVPDMRFAQR
jgi:hypothetical protein